MDCTPFKCSVVLVEMGQLEASVACSECGGLGGTNCSPCLGSQGAHRIPEGGKRPQRYLVAGAKHEDGDL